MVNLFEIMQSAQGGKAYSNLAQQFGIGTDQAQQAVEAVLPAISMGLRQQAQSVEGWQNILSGLSQSQTSADAFDADGDGIPDYLQKEGHNALGTMFGGPEMAQHVATNAAQFAGLPASMMQQMLPIIASMVMGGLFKGATNNGLGGLLGQMMQGGAQSGGLGGGLGGILGQMMGQPQPQQPQGNIFGNILGQMMGGQPVPSAPRNPAGDSPMGGLFGTILSQMTGGGRPAPEPQPAPNPMGTGLDALKGMFETGKDVHGAQMDAWQQILGKFTQPR